MLGVEVEKRNAEKLRRLLGGKIDCGYKIARYGPVVRIPLAEEPDVKESRALGKLGGRIVHAEFIGRGLRPSYKELIKHVEAESPLRAKGYDLLGNIATVEAPAGAAKKIAEALMDSNKNIKTVLRKGGAVSGRYRTRKFYHVLGERNFLAKYVENGCVFVFDVRKVFFSTRLAYERKRINCLIRKRESVVVMFAGVGPYAIEIAKSHAGCKVVAMELNSAACEYMRENIKINKVCNVACEQGDVRRLAEKYEGFADRIIMPLPKTASTFLEEALLVAGRKCVVHYYAFCKSEGTAEAIERIRAFFKSRGAGFRLLNERVVRSYSAKEIEIVVDFLISKSHKKEY